MQIQLQADHEEQDRDTDLGQQVDLVMSGDKTQHRRSDDDADHDVGNQHGLTQPQRQGAGKGADQQKQREFGECVTHSEPPRPRRACLAERFQLRSLFALASMTKGTPSATAMCPPRQVARQEPRGDHAFQAILRSPPPREAVNSTSVGRNRLTPTNRVEAIPSKPQVGVATVAPGAHHQLC